MKRFLIDEIDDAYEHSVETEDDHSTDGDVDDDLGSEFVCATPEVDDGEDGEETNDEIESNVNEEIFFEVRFFHITGLAQYVSQEEERDTAH